MKPVAAISLLLLLLGVAASAETILTERLVIRRFAAADAPVVRALSENLDVQRAMNVHIKPESKERVILDLLGQRRNGMPRHGFVAHLRGTDVPVGFFYVTERNPGGYWTVTTALFPTFWSQGYGTEFRRAVTEHVFTELQLPGLVSEIFSDNERSRRVAERLGFQWVATLPPREDAIRSDGSWEEYRLDRATYRQESDEAEALRSLTKTREQVQKIEREVFRRRNRVRGIAEALQLDAYFRRQFSAEQRSLFAEGLADGTLSLEQIFCRTYRDANGEKDAAVLASAFLRMWSSQIQGVRLLAGMRRRTPLHRRRPVWQLVLDIGARSVVLGTLERNEAASGDPVPLALAAIQRVEESYFAKPSTRQWLCARLFGEP